MNKYFLIFAFVGLALLLVLFSLTACTRPSAISNTPSPTNSSSTSSVPRGMLFPDIHDFLIVKYSPTGKQIWKILEDLGEKDVYVPMNLDRSGNSYISGSSYDVKYDSNGQQVYFNTFVDSNMRPYASALDEHGNIYLTGSSNAGDLVVSKYDINGRQVWSAIYQYSGNPVTVPSGITLDKSGNIYIAGSTSPSKDVTESNLLILKYDNSGKLLWSARDDGLLQGQTTIGPVVDSGGDVYVTGLMLNSTANSKTTNCDYVTVKYNTNGTKAWENYYNGPANGYDAPHALEADSKGDVIVTGESDGNGNIGNTREIAIIKHDSSGKELWVSRYAGEDGYGGTPSVLTIDDQGNIYVAGEGLNRPNGDDYVTIKYDPDGQQLWQARYQGTGKGLNKASAIFVDDKGNVYVAGQCTLDSQYVTFDTVKYSSDGNRLWVAQYNKAIFVDSPGKLAVDALGNVYMIGRVSYYSDQRPN